MDMIEVKSGEEHLGDTRDYEYMITVPQEEGVKYTRYFRCMPTTLPKCFAHIKEKLKQK